MLKLKFQNLFDQQKVGHHLVAVQKLWERRLNKIPLKRNKTITLEARQINGSYKRVTI